jgi:hypothetical protein
MKHSPSRPIFRSGHFFAVASIAGRYMPPSGKPSPRGFLGLYFAKVPDYPCFSFHTFAQDGRQLAYSAVSPEDANLEFALIWGLIHYEIPLAQWRPFPVSAPERQILRKAGIGSEYDRVKRSLGHVLYQARGRLLFNLSELPPLFRAKLRSDPAIRRDLEEREAVLHAVGFNT